MNEITNVSEYLAALAAGFLHGARHRKQGGGPMQAILALARIANHGSVRAKRQHGHHVSLPIFRTCDDHRESMQMVVAFEAQHEHLASIDALTLPHGPFTPDEIRQTQKLQAQYFHERAMRELEFILDTVIDDTEPGNTEHMDC